MLSPLNSTGIALTKLIGKKELTFGCIGINQGELYICTGNENFIKISKLYDRGHIFSSYGFDEEDIEIIGHPAQLSDFHSFLNKIYPLDVEYRTYWNQLATEFRIGALGVEFKKIPYDSSKELLDQDEETLKQIVELVKSNK